MQIFLIVLIFSTYLFSEELNQEKINLNKLPCSRTKFEIDISGFEIDSQENMYFLGGTNNTLKQFNKTGTVIFEKSFTEFNTNSIKLIRNEILIFDNFQNKNNLIHIDTNTGQITRFVNHLTDSRVNSYYFTDSSIVLEIFKKQNSDHGFEYQVFDLLGEYLFSTNNKYNLPSSLFKEENNLKVMSYLGKCGDNYIFKNYNFDNNYIRLGLFNNDGKIEKYIKIYVKIFGHFFAPAPDDHWKIVNNNLFVLGYKTGNAIITKLNLNEIFSSPKAYSCKDSITFEDINRILFLNDYLSTLSKDQLKIERNEIFARKGKKFKTKWLQDYFERQLWYHPNPNYKDDWISDFEKQLIQKIKFYEDKK